MALKERSERLGLPLFLIGHGNKGFVGKTRLQKIIYLIQNEAKLDIYDFRKHYYGPFSRELDNDLLSSQDLVEVISHPKILAPHENYFEFKLTPEGMRVMEEMKKSLSEPLRVRIESLINRYSALPLGKLLEEAYATFDAVDDRLRGLERSTDRLRDNVREIFNTHCNRQSLFILTVLDYVKDVLEKAKDVRDEVQKAVILRLAAELVETCEEAFPEIAPPVDSEKLRPVFMNIADVWLALIEYCDKRRIVKNPFEARFDEILSEDEAVRLQTAMQAIELKA